MNFLKKIDHLKLVQVALGISIFSIGYLITMFYFQMKDLKEFKHQIIIYNTAGINALHLEAELERDNYFTQSLLLNQTVLSRKTQVDDRYINSFLENTDFLNSNDANFIDKKSEITALIEIYKVDRNELLKNNSNKNLANYNATLVKLSKAIKTYSNYIESKIIVCNNNYDDLIDHSKTSGFLIALIALTIFVLAYVKMNEDLENLKRTNDEIIFMNQTLNNAEMVAGFGSWKFNTVENKFIFLLIIK